MISRGVASGWLTEHREARSINGSAFRLRKAIANLFFSGELPVSASGTLNYATALLLIFHVNAERNKSARFGAIAPNWTHRPQRFQCHRLNERVRT